MIRWVARCFFGLIAILLILFIFLLTPYGFHQSLKLIEKNLPGKLTFQHISGNIFGPINISNLTYDAKNMHVTIGTAHLQWRLPMLFLKTLDIANFEASNIQVHLIKHASATKNKQTQNPVAVLDLPFALKVEKANINNVQLYYGNHVPIATIDKISINKLKLSNRKIRGTIDVNLIKPYKIESHIYLKGDLEKYQINWSITKAQNQFSLNGIGNTKSITVSLDGSKLYQSQVSGDATISWFPFWSWKSDINIKNLNLKKFNTALPNITSANLKSSGYWKQKMPVFDLNANIDAPGVHINAVGSHKNTWNINFQANVKKLDQLIPSMSGSIQSRGTITGSNQDPELDAKFNATNLYTDNISADTLQGEIKIDFGFLQASKLKLDGTNVKAPFLNASTLKLSANSTAHLKQIHANLNLNTQQYQNISLDSELDGRLTQNIWQGKLVKFRFQSPKAGLWRLQSPSRLYLSQEKITLKDACWHARSGKTCVNIDWDKTNPWQINANGHLTNLNLLTELASPFLTIRAPTLFKVNIRGFGQTITDIKSNLNIDNGSLTFSKDFQSFKYPLKKMTIDLNTKNNDLILQTNALVAKKDFLTANIVIHDFQKRIKNDTLNTSQVSGKVKLSLSTLRLLEMFTPYVSQPKGLLQANFDVSGSLPLPNIEGKVTLKNGYINIPSLKVQLDNIQMTIHAKNKALNYTITAHSEKLPITITGKTQYKNNKLISTLKFSGKDVLVANTPQYTIYVSPDLQARLVGNSAVITGKIIIPKAVIKPADFSSTVSLPADVVIVSQHKITKQSPLKWVMNVSIVLGDHVTINTRGLNGQLHGDLKITHEVTQPNAVATGQITLTQATFSTQGKTLTIAEGSNINYIHDSINNPHLSIRASRTVSVVSDKSGFQLGPTKSQVGIDIKGTVSHPSISLFSSPIALSQADILSYLLFGSPASGGSASNLSAIVGAVSSLKLGGDKSDVSISRIKQRLGITELGVQEQTYIDAFGTPLGINQSSFVIGSYITPKIYVRYNRGLVTPVDIYQVRYIFNKHWSIQTETGSGSQSVGTGVDVLYTISRKKFPY